MHAPQLRQPGGLEPLARIGRTTKRLGGLAQVVLKEPRLGEGAADLDLFVAGDAGTFQQANQQRGRFFTAAPFERFERLSQTVRRRHVGEQYTSYTPADCRNQAPTIADSAKERAIAISVQAAKRYPRIL